MMRFDSCRVKIESPRSNHHLWLSDRHRPVWDVVRQEAEDYKRLLLRRSIRTVVGRRFFNSCNRDFDHHFHFSAGHRLLTRRKLSISSTCVRVPFGSSCHLAVVHPVILSWAATHGLPASRSALRRENQGPCSLAVCRHAEHR